MTSHSRISVCIANYNGLDVIDDCIRSILEQTGVENAVEIIVHDDASTDDSAAHIRECYPDVHLIESDENVGFCVANNRMAIQAHGEYLLLLNNDASLFPDALSTLYREAQETGAPAILSVPQYDYESGKLLDRGCLLDPFLNPIPNLDPACTNVAMVMGACLWIPRGLWQTLGGFPEWFESVGEDLYLCCRARLAGNPVRVTAGSGYRHRVGQSFGGGKVQGKKLTTTFRRRALTERNKTYVLVSTFPTPYVQILLPIHLLLLLIEGMLLSLLKFQHDYLTKIYLPVFAGLWQQRRSLLSRRHAIMAQRRLVNRDFFAVFDPLPYKLRMLLRHGLPHVS